MARNKVVLIYVQDYASDNALKPVPESLNMPLGILYLGSYLSKNEHKVSLLDTRLKEKETFLNYLRNELDDTLLVGLSVMTPYIRYALEISKLVKNLEPHIHIVWGGVHPTLFPPATIHNKYVDFVIVKEGERGLLGLTEHLLHNRQSISDIPNLVFKADNEMVQNKVEIGEDLNAIGAPNYGLIDVESYIDRVTHRGCRRRQAEVLTSRGCPHECTFCINVVVNQRRWRTEFVEQTLESIDWLLAHCKIEHLFFMDEDFFCNRDRAGVIIDEIAKRGITWESNCRVDYIKDGYINDEFLKRIKESGCIKLRFGVESGSQRVLDLLNKKITVEESIHAVKKLTEYKIEPSASFMMGIPGEAVSDVVKTMGLILELFSINRGIDIVGPQIFRPYPGSVLFEKCQERGLIIPKSLEEWSNFYIHSQLDEYANNFPWFADSYIFKRVYRLRRFLTFNIKSNLLRWVVIKIVKFHIITKLRFIDTNYLLYKMIRKFAGIVLRRKARQNFRPITL